MWGGPGGQGGRAMTSTFEAVEVTGTPDGTGTDDLGAAWVRSIRDLP